MVCLYCGSNTRVTNSREQKRLRQTWRRRACQKCKAIFTTLEAADLSGSLRVVDKLGTLEPFERDRLFISLFQSLGHRTDALGAAKALTATVIGFILTTAQEGRIERTAIIDFSAATLDRFDPAAAVQYRAYHRA